MAVPLPLGIALADYLGVWAESDLLPPAGRVGVLLTGDLYRRAAPTGAVLDVWLAR